MDESNNAFNGSVKPNSNVRCVICGKKAYVTVPRGKAEFWLCDGCQKKYTKNGMETGKVYKLC